MEQAISQLVTQAAHADPFMFFTAATHHIAPEFMSLLTRQ